VTHSYAGQFDVATCKNSESFAKRVFLTKSQGMSYKKYREVEGPAGNGAAARMVEAIERGIFTNNAITSTDLAAQYAYSTCMTW
jgi:hypothetical protein